MVESVEIGPNNGLPGAREGLRLRPDLMICDCTLREGEQAAEVGFNVEEKMRVAERIVAAGIRLMEGGFSKSETDRRFMRALKAAGLPVRVEAKVQAFGPDWRAQVDAGIDCGADILGLMHPTSLIRLQNVERISPQEMIDQVVTSVRYAAGRGPMVRFSGIDASRTDLDLLISVCRAAVEAGAEAVGVPDTVGCMAPAGMRYMISRVVEAVPVPVQIHCHNDFGCALANTLAAAEAGAHILDASVNGLGERSGNACLDELVATIQVLYGLDLGIDMAQLTPLARFVADLSGVPLSITKPLTGGNAFSHKSDAHVRAVEQNPRVFEVVDPSVVGNQRRFPMGKHTGPYGVGKRLRAMGMSATEDQLRKIIEGIERQAVSQKRALTEAEFAELARSVTSE